MQSFIKIRINTIDELKKKKFLDGLTFILSQYYLCET